jgi:hypothetical protein
MSGTETQEEYHKVLVSFFIGVQHKYPWWYPIIARVDEDKVTLSVPEMMGLDDEMFQSICVREGLVSFKRRNKEDPLKLCVEMGQWKHLIKDNNLLSFMEVSKTKIGDGKTSRVHYIVYIGDRWKQLHTIQRQYCINIGKRLTSRPKLWLFYQQRKLKSGIQEATTTHLVQARLRAQERVERAEPTHYTNAANEASGGATLVGRDGSTALDTEELRPPIFDSIKIHKDASPILSRLCDDGGNPAMHEYNTLICEITELSHNQSHRSVDFTHHSNSKRGRLVSVPSHTSQEKCVYKAWNKCNQLVEAILDKLAGEDSNKDDTPQWISVNNQLRGLGDKDESLIEHLHQVGSLLILPEHLLCVLAHLWEVGCLGS